MLDHNTLAAHEAASAASAPVTWTYAATMWLLTLECGRIAKCRIKGGFYPPARYGEREHGYGCPCGRRFEPADDGRTWPLACNVEYRQLVYSIRRSTIMEASQ